MDKGSELYRQLLADTRSFNGGLSEDRRHRMPFIDSHTGIAQIDCSLWHSESERQRIQHKDGRNDATIYCYPAQRWRKRRREYLLKSEASSNRMNSVSSNQGKPEHSQSVGQELLDNRISPITDCTYYNNAQASINSDYLVRYTSGIPTQQRQQQQQQQQQGPPRTDSTGSHSNVDSDSRDQSSTNSQTQDSPRHDTPTEHDEQISCNNLESHFSAAKRQPVISIPQSLTHVKSKHRSDDHLKEAEGTHEGRFPTGREDNQILRDQQTREAIRFQSRMSRKRNAGQSLIKSNNSCNSILVKDGQNCIPALGNEQLDFINGQLVEDEKEKEKEKQLSAESMAKPSRCNGSRRPYVCSICDQTYKTRQGLSYHTLHSHNNMGAPRSTQRDKDVNFSSQKESCQRKVRKASKIRRIKRKVSIEFKQNEHISSNSKAQAEGGDVSQTAHDGPCCGEKLPNGAPPDDHLESCQETELSNDSDTIASVPVFGHQDESNQGEETDISDNQSPSQLEMDALKVGPMIGGNNNNQRESEMMIEVRSETKSTISKKAKPSHFCDFCHGTGEKNRRTRLPEKLISCSSCGSSGHPSCLRFSENICSSVKRYDWQCIDCKTCSICNKADDEDQLLFCDDCDRSYHTYCMDPPLRELPEGNWSCSLCLVEYYDRK